MVEPICLNELETIAIQKLPKSSLDYYKSGALSETTLKNNRSSFTRLRIRPKFMRDVSKRSCATTILGKTVSMPVGISPTAMQKMAHPEGECANAKAAEEAGTIYILSTIATSSIEEVAAAAPRVRKWFQLYVFNDRDVTANLVRRAEKAGFEALVLTVDAPIFGIRLADIRNNFALPPHLSLANFVGQKFADVISEGEGSGINNYVARLFDASLEWKDIEWLRSITKLPIILKGILTAEDAIKGMDYGVAGILVSNHGARQMDGVPASIECLPEVVKAVGHQLEVYLDGGIREGTDVFRALALGAKMVFVGRPAIWGLAYNGQEGVARMLNILRNEFDNTLGLAGCTSVADITRNMVTHEQYYSKL